MPLRVDAYNPTPICQPGVEPLADIVAGGSLPGAPALPRELDGVGIPPNAVERAIEDLTRSGYRPLHARLTPPDRSSIPRACVAPVRDA